MCIDLVLADPYPVMLDGLSHAFDNSPEFSVKSCVHHGDAAGRAGDAVAVNDPTLQ